MRKKNKGFSLIEIIMVLGIISSLTFVVYSVTAKKNTDYTLNRQAELIEQIIISLNDYFAITSDTGTSSETLMDAIISPSNLIEQKIIPAEMADNSTDPDGNPIQTVKTLWGTPVVFDAISVDLTPDISGDPNVTGYSISLNGVPNDYCSKLASNSKIVLSSQIISVNGEDAKTAGSSDIDLDVVTGCTSETNSNTILITTVPFKQGVAPLSSSNAPGGYREKENKYFIAPIGTNTTTTSTTCPSGTSWDGTLSICQCSTTGTFWNGTTCTSYSSTTAGTSDVLNQAGLCQLNQKWDPVNKACISLSTCVAGQIYDPISNSCISETTTSCSSGTIYDRIRKTCITVSSATPPTTGTKTLCIPGGTTTDCVTVENYKIISTTPATQAGRQIPASVFTNNVALDTIGTNTTHSAQQTNTTSQPYINNANGSTACPSSSRPRNALQANNGTGSFTTPIANFDGTACAMCVSGIWDGDRCVTQ